MAYDKRVQIAEIFWFYIDKRLSSRYMVDARESKFQHRLASACVGSVATSFVANPFDVVRVRLQQANAVAGSNASPNSIKTEKWMPKGRYRISSRDALRDVPLIYPHQVSAFSSMPNLGVNACCRDVFSFPSTLDYCIATPELLPCAINTARSPPASSFKLLSTIVSDEGVKTLWRGATLQLVQSIPSNVIYFLSYEHMRDNSPIQHSGILNPLLCGGLARAFASTIVSPIELVKTRMQSFQGEKSFTIVVRSVHDMVRRSGLRSLWNGVTLTLWRDVPFSSIYWLFVEAIRQSFPVAQNHRDKVIESCTAGFLGGSIAAVATTPFDVGKTRRQLGHGDCPGLRMRMSSFLLHIARKEGMRALFVGVVPRVLKVAPACAIMISSYELGKRIFSEDGMIDEMEARLSE